MSDWLLVDRNFIVRVRTLSLCFHLHQKSSTLPPGAGKVYPNSLFLSGTSQPDPSASQPWHTPLKTRKSHQGSQPKFTVTRGSPMPPWRPPRTLPEHWRRKKNPVPATYLKEPVAPPVESGDDGGMDIAAVQTLGREEKREFSWKEGRKEGRQGNREEQEGPCQCWQAWGD